MLVACGREVPPPARASGAPRPEPAVTGDDEPGEVGRRLGELFARGMRGDDPEALAAAFRELRGVARPEELPFVDRVEKLAREMSAAGDDMDAMLAATVAAMGDLERLAPDLEARVAVVHQSIGLALMATGTGVGSQADQLALGASERLVRDHPADPRAGELRAVALRKIGGDLRGALAAARRCAPVAPGCAEVAAHLVREIETPRCTAADLKPGFALHRGTSRGAAEGATREVTIGSSKVWIASEPALAAGDLTEIKGAGEQLLLVLAPAAERKLETFLVQSAFLDSHGVVFVEGEVVGDAPRMMPMMRGMVLLASAPGSAIALESICSRVTRERASD
jgi:hypothetical protein